LTTSADIDVLAGREKTSLETSALGESLDKLPGVTNIATGSQVGKPVIRGLSSNRIRILTDGISMDYQQYGVRHWANVDPYTAERIEVVRGASSVLYGSDALGGAVNIIPNQIPDASDGHTNVRGKALSHYSTNNNEILGALQLEGKYGGFGWTGTLIRRSADNINVPHAKTATETGLGTDPKFTGELDYTDFDQLNGSLGIGYHTGFGRIDGNFIHWDDEHNFLLPNGKGIGQKLENDLLQVKGLFPFGSNWIVQPTLSYLENLRQSNRAGSPRERLPDEIVIDLLLKTYTGRLVIEHDKIGVFAGQFGMEYMYEDQDTRGSVPLTPSATIANYAGFVFEEAELGRFLLSLGMRFDEREQEVEPDERMQLPDYDAGETDGILKQTYQVFSGSIGGAYRFTENLVLAGNAGRGFRAPSVFELHVYGEHGGIAAFQIGDPNMKEETSLNTDISIRWRSPGLQAKATAYRNAIDNYIYLYNTGEIHSQSGNPIMKTTQVDAVLLGADLSVQAQILPWLQIRGGFETVKGENVDTDEKLPLLPATKAEGEARFTQRSWSRLENVYLSFGVRHAAEKEAAGRYEPFWQFDANPNFGVASTDAYTLFDLGLGFDLALGDRYFNFDLTIKNLLNEEYRDFLDTYKGYALSPGRNVIFKLNVPFKIL
jgi:iron complex outermembrane receptor protein/hemoglobin/transferrin/lactoferrin receptor protein